MNTGARATCSGAAPLTATTAPKTVARSRSRRPPVGDPIRSLRLPAQAPRAVRAAAPPASRGTVPAPAAPLCGRSRRTRDPLRVCGGGSGLPARCRRCGARPGVGVGKKRCIGSPAAGAGKPRTGGQVRECREPVSVARRALRLLRTVHFVHFVGRVPAGCALREGASRPSRTLPVPGRGHSCIRTLCPTHE